MASISMNPFITEQAAVRMASTLRHSHQFAIMKGILVSLAILAIGLFTMAMPALGPASDNAMSITNESRAAYDNSHSDDR